MTAKEIEPGYYWVKLKKWNEYRMCEYRPGEWSNYYPFREVTNAYTMVLIPWESIELISERLEPPKI